MLFALACSACAPATPEPVQAKTIVVAPEREPASDSDAEPVNGAPPEPERKAANEKCQPNSDETSLEKARKLFKEGVELYEQGEFGAAASAFKESYALSCRAALLQNLARCYEQLGDMEGAISTYEIVVRDGDPTDPLVELAKRRLEELAKRR